MNEQYLHSEITQKVIGCAYEVHRFLGCGFQEIIYQRALALELEKARLSFAREQEIPIYYKEYKEEIGTRRADFVVENKVLVELKAIETLDNLQVVQILNYLRIYGFEVGLLINFGNTTLGLKRMVL